MYYHFAGKSKFTHVKPWYALAGIFWSERYYKKRYPYFRIGRSFNFSKKTGLNLDFGAICCDFDYFITPSFNIGFFVRFKSPF